MNLICFCAVLYLPLQSNDPVPDELDEQPAELLLHDHVLPPAFLIQDYAKGMFFMYNWIMRTCF